MSIAIPDFWKLVVEARLLSEEQCRKLEAEFGGVKGAANSTNAKALAEWLVSRKALSRYQSTVLLAGRPGPFYYGDYRVYDRVESGSLKGQFRAIHAPSGHPVMLRFLAGSVLKDNREWALVAARVQKQTGLVYPLLQRYFEPVDLQAFRFVATEDLHGETLDEVLARHGRLPPMEAARLVRLAAFALSYLHQLGIVHGDVRPGQLLLEPSGNVKLLIDPAQVHGAVNVALLDPASPAAARVDYLAPEFLQANKTPDAHTDVYALGCTFYQLLTGTVPFPGGLPGQKLARHAAEPIQPLEPYGVPHPLAQLVAFVMAKNPAVRTQQMAIIAEQLVPYIEPARLQLPPSTPPATLATYENWIKQKQAVLTSAAKVQAAPIGPAIDVTKKADGKPAETKPAITIAAAKPTVAARAATASKVSPKNQQMLLIGGGVAAAALVVALVVIMAGSGGEEGGGKPIAKAPDKNPEVPTTNVSTDVKPPTVQKNPNNGTTTPPDKVPGTTEKPNVKPPMDDVPVAKFDVQPDDGKLLWASPTSGSAISLGNVPPNAQIFLVARPAEMLASPQGQLVIEALGPNFTSQRTAWEKSAGVKLADVEQLVIALHDAGGTIPRPSYRVTLKAPIAEGDLLKLWGNPAATEVNGHRYFTGAGRAFYVPSAASGSVFTMGDPADIKEVAAASGSPPVLRREIDQLRKLSDNDRHFTVLLAPNYLTTGARDLFNGPYEKLRGPIEWFLGDEAKSAMLSMHFGDTFYVEMREIANVDLEKNKLAADLKAKLAEMPKHVEDYINNLNAPAYWKKVATRYPGMIYFLHRQTRVGVEDDVAIVNAVAPGALAHNLFFGGELALASTPGAMVAAGPSATDSKPKSIDDLLKKKSSFEVPRNDMNLAMADLEKEVKGDSPDLPFEFAIKILGKDLEAEGITRNQAIVNFKMEGAPLADILTGLVRKANPVTTVKDPSEVDQKLIWVVGPDPDKPDKQVVLITTRKAAGEKKYTLPAPFVPKKT